MLINVKMPTIVGILTFMSKINFVLSSVEHEKSFITLGPDLTKKQCDYFTGLLSGKTFFIRAINRITHLGK